MATSLEALHAEAQRLSPSDRARLLERLIVRLDSDAEAAWDAVARTSETEMTSGAVLGVTLDDAIARLDARFEA